MTLSKFGDHLCGDAGIVSLMEDLGEALNVNPDVLFLGGGNPAAIPAVEALIARRLRAMSEDVDKVHKLVGVYQSPRGNETFVRLLADYLNTHQGWNISERNIAVTNGSQSAFFTLFNMLAGPTAKGRHRQICLPMMPEYLGYKDQALAANLFRSFQPNIELHGANGFKYHVDFDALKLDDSVAALCVSRPTNPTGNVLTDSEMARLDGLSCEYGIPLIVDCAYGEPFPGIVYGSVSSCWKPNQIVVLSLSKLGLPGVRTGIVVAAEEVIERLVSANTVQSLATGNLGPMLAAELLANNELQALCKHTVLPYYQQKRAEMLALVEHHFDGISYRIHKSEGAFFLWVWFPELTISSEALYQRLKARNVLVMAGEHFFFGLDEPWQHQSQCLRLNFCQSESVMDQALAILAEEIRGL